MLILYILGSSSVCERRHAQNGVCLDMMGRIKQGWGQATREDF